MKKSFLIVLFFIASCGSVDKSKFEAFNNSVSSLTDQTQEALRSSQRMTREEGIRKLTEGKESKPSELRIKVEEFDWIMEREPTYIKLQKAERKLVQLNNLFSSYSNLLLNIAQSKAEDSKAFSELAGKLNKNANNLLKTTNANVELKTTGIISSAAISSLEAFLTKKREKYLREAIKNNQQYVSDYISHMVLIIDLIKELKIKVYNDLFTVQSIEWLKSSNKKSNSQEIFNLNDDLIVQLETLRLLRESLNVLPEIHSTLQKEGSGSLKVRIAYLNSSLKRFKQIQTELKDQK